MNSTQVILVIGLRPRLAYDAKYAGFIRAVAANIGAVIAEAQDMLASGR